MASIKKAILAHVANNKNANNREIADVLSAKLGTDITSVDVSRAVRDVRRERSSGSAGTSFGDYGVASASDGGVSY